VTETHRCRAGDHLCDRRASVTLVWVFRLIGVKRAHDQQGGAVNSSSTGAPRFDVIFEPPTSRARASALCVCPRAKADKLLLGDRCQQWPSCVLMCVGVWERLDVILSCTQRIQGAISEPAVAIC
jgi:hypothetical protein